MVGEGFKLGLFCVSNMCVKCIGVWHVIRGT